MMLRALQIAIAFLAAATPAGASAREVKVAPGVNLRVIEAGRGSATPLVLIPGWSTGADVWREQISHFSASRRVVSFDPRSQGASSKTLTGNTPEQRAQDLHAVLKTLEVRRPVLVGWSQGAQDLAAYVEKYGALDLAGIVLVDAAISDGAAGIAEQPASTAEQFARFNTYMSHQEAYLRGMFAYIIKKPQPQGAIDKLVATGMKTPNTVGLTMLVADMFSVDRTPSLAKMSSPVLIIAAASSGELERQKGEAKKIPHAKFVQIDDAGHAAFLDQPARFDALLAAFLEELPGR